MAEACFMGLRRQSQARAGKREPAVRGHPLFHWESPSQCKVTIPESFPQTRLSKGCCGFSFLPLTPVKTTINISRVSTAGGCCWKGRIWHHEHVLGPGAEGGKVWGQRWCDNHRASYPVASAWHPHSKGQCGDKSCRIMRQRIFFLYEGRWGEWEN